MAEMEVGHYISNVPEDYIDISVAVPAPPSSGEIKDKKQAQMEVLKVVAVLLIVVSAVGIGDLSFGVGFYADPDQEFLLKVYAIVILTTFELGMGMLFISVVLKQVPIPVAIAKKLVWVVVAFVYISLSFNIILRDVEFGGFK